MKLFKDYAALAGGQVAGKIVGLLTFAWLARVLDPQGYGAVEYVLGLSVFFTTVVEGGLGVVGVRRCAERPAALEQLATQIPLARLMLAAVCVPVMTGIAVASKSSAPAGLIGLFALGLLTQPWRQDWLLQAHERMNEAALSQIVRAVVFAALAFALVRRQQDLLGVGWAELGSLLAMTAYCLYVQHTRITPVAWRGPSVGFGSLVQEGIVVGAANVVFAMNQYAPLLLIGLLAGGAETAWLAAALRLIGSLFVFSYIYHYSLYPAQARALARKDGALSRLLTRSCRVTAWAGIFGALALVLFAHPLVAIVFGAKLAPAAALLQVMAWMLPVALCSGHARWALVAAGAQRKVLWCQTTGLLATVGGALALQGLPGGLGYAVAALLGFGAVWIAAHVFAARAGTPPPPFQLALKPLLVSGAIIALVQASGWEPWLAAIGLLVYAAAAPLLDRQLLPDLVLLGQAKMDVARPPSSA